MKTVCLIGILMLFTSAWCQVGTISGTVKTADGQSAVSIQLRIQALNQTSQSDKNGAFSFQNIAIGTYNLDVFVANKIDQELQVVVKENQVLQVDVILKESAQELQEIVVSANKSRYLAENLSNSLRLDEPLLEVPQNIQLVAKEVLNDQQVISMSDGLVRNVSGTSRVEHWGDLYTNVISRGSQIQAFRNGFNVVNSYWGPLTEDMSFVDHIEFVKGPAGFMLASGDPAGLYNVVTKKPTGQTKGEINFTLGSFDLFKAALDLDGKLTKNGKLLYRLNVAAQNKKSNRANEFNDRYTIAPVLSYQLDKNTKLTLEYTYQRANMSNVGSFYVFSTKGYGTLPRNFTMLPAGMPTTGINDHSTFATLEHKISSNWKVTAQVSRFIYEQKGSSMWLASIDSNDNMNRYVSSWQAYSAMTMGQLFLNGTVQTGKIKHRILGGLDVANKSYQADWGQYHELDSAGALFQANDPNLGTPVNGYPNFDFETTPLSQRAQGVGGLMDQRYAALYIQDELGFWNNRIRLTLAGRYTYIQQAEFGGKPKEAKQFTPRVGLSASLTENTAFYALYDQAFIPQTGKLSNGKAVQPITGNNVELGLKRDWFDKKWNTTLAVYRIIKNNELTADPSAAPTAGLSIELGQKVAQGIEFDVKGTLFKGMNVIANYALTDARVTRVAEGVTALKVGDVVPGFSTHTANVWLNYSVQSGLFKGFGVNGGVSFLGDRKTYYDLGPDPTMTLPNYTKVDAGIFWEKNNIKLTANVFNLLDSYLYTGSYYSYLKSYYWQTEPGRNFRISLNYKF